MSVEFDQPTPELPELRICANCACFSAMTEKGEIIDPASNSEAMRVCRRNPPGGRMVRVEAPVHDPKTGAPVIDRGRPRLQAKQVLQIGYQPTIETASCFDGWRPLGTLPGERWETQRMLGGFLPFLQKALIQAGVSAKQAEQMGAAMLTGMLPPKTKPS
jgi:hypothetical protein